MTTKPLPGLSADPNESWSVDKLETSWKQAPNQHSPKSPRACLFCTCSLYPLQLSRSVVCVCPRALPCDSPAERIDTDSDHHQSQRTNHHLHLVSSAVRTTITSNCAFLARSREFRPQFQCWSHIFLPCSPQRILRPGLLFISAVTVRPCPNRLPDPSLPPPAASSHQLLVRFSTQKSQLQ